MKRLPRGPSPPRLVGVRSHFFASLQLTGRAKISPRASMTTFSSRMARMDLRTLSRNSLEPAGTEDKAKTSATGVSEKRSEAKGSIMMAFLDGCRRNKSREAKRRTRGGVRGLVPSLTNISSSLEYFCYPRKYLERTTGGGGKLVTAGPRQVRGGGL